MADKSEMQLQRRAAVLAWLSALVACLPLIAGYSLDPGVLVLAVVFIAIGVAVRWGRPSWLRVAAVIMTAGALWLGVAFADSVRWGRPPVTKASIAAAAVLAVLTALQSYRASARLVRLP